MEKREDGPETCSTCRNWKESKAIVRGTCRRYPPQPYAGDMCQPVTKADDWCGEYQGAEGQPARRA